MGDLTNQVEDAMWRGDKVLLNEIAPCGCCCNEHFFHSCPARVWNGCRGQWGSDAGGLSEDEQKSWERVLAERGLKL